MSKYKIGEERAWAVNEGALRKTRWMWAPSKYFRSPVTGFYFDNNEHHFLLTSLKIEKVPRVFVAVFTGDVFEFSGGTSYLWRIVEAT